MALDAPVGLISKPLSQVAAALNLSSEFSVNFPNVHYNIVGRPMNAAEVMTQGEVQLTRPFALLVPDYPDGIRATARAYGCLPSHAGTIWVKLEKEQAIEHGGNYEERQRYWDNQCGTILQEMEAQLVDNQSVLSLLGWHSYVSELSSERERPGKGSFYRSAFKIDWGSQ